LSSETHAVWEAVFRRQEWGKYPSEHVVRFVARNYYGAADRRAVRLLDLGSGPGASTWFMAREGFSVSAIDGSTAAIAKLRDRLVSEGLEVDARVGDLGELPWPDGTFDAVVDNAAVYCNPFADCRRIVAGVRRVLKPGGCFLSASFTDRTWGYGRGREVEPGAFVEISEGPLADKGLALFFGRARLDELYSEFVDRRIERLAWTLEGEQHLVEMWIVTCKKTS
jgi:SAM-dependent methyltransferase